MNNLEYMYEQRLRHIVIWPDIFCGINANASQCVPNRDYVISAGCGDCFRNSMLTFNNLTILQIGWRTCCVTIHCFAPWKEMLNSAYSGISSCMDTTVIDSVDVITVCRGLALSSVSDVGINKILIQVVRWRRMIDQTQNQTYPMYFDRLRSCDQCIWRQ